MFDVNKVNWDVLMKSDYKYFSFFQPDKDKIKFIADKLLNGYLNTSDEFRNTEKIWQMIFYYFPPDGNFPLMHTSLFYEIGDFDGLVGFRNILPEFKCGIGLTLWNGKKLFKSMGGRDFIREGQTLIKTIMDEFKLKRIESTTPDKKIKKLANIIGFKTEGACARAFKWNDKFYTSYMLSITK